MKRFFVLACILVFVLSLSVTVFAGNSSGYDFYDYDDFATYRNDGDSINVTLDLPFQSCYQFLDGTTKSFYNSSFSVTLNENFDLRINPFFYHGTPPSVGNKYSYGNFLDLTKMPKNFTLNTSYTFTVLGGNFEDIVSAVTYVAFVDDVGKVVYRSSLDTTITTNFTPDSCLVQFDDSFDSSTANIPSSAKGMFLFIVADCTNVYDNVHLTFNMQPFTLSFNISDAFFNFKNESIVRDELSNINKQLDSIINGNVNGISPPGQSDFDDLHENEQELLDQSQNYLDNGLSFFQNASGVILGLGNGFEAIKVLVQPVFALPFANSLITVSVSLGLIATLIGVAIASISNGSSSKKGGKGGK